MVRTTGVSISKQEWTKLLLTGRSKSLNKLIRIVVTLNLKRKNWLRSKTKLPSTGNELKLPEKTQFCGQNLCKMLKGK
jgi:hypothetical protein